MCKVEMTEREKAMAVLNDFLSMQFPQYHDKFTEKNKCFLVRYSILKESGSPNSVLKSIGEEIPSIDIYWGDTGSPHVKDVHTALQELYKRFKNFEKKDDAAFGGFVGFLKWWVDQAEQGKHHCYYCGIEESKTKKAFKTGAISSKKFYGSLQVDRKNPEKGYNADNCVFSCVLCNNAKSDMISETDFKTYFGQATKAFWEHIADET